MTNSYEVPEVIPLGRVNETILGTKPPANEVESIYGFGWYFFLPDDIDASDD